MKDTTHDTLYAGRLVLRQPEEGYRFSVDSPLLTWFAYGSRRSSTTADLGAGVGVIGLGLLLSGHSKRVTAVEVQSRLAALAAENAALNGVSSSFELLEKDVRDLRRHPRQGSFDLVVSNPPFWPADAGRLPESEERRIACHEILGDLDDWMSAARRLLNPKTGRLSVVFPARRLDALLLALDRVRLSTTRLIAVHPFPSKPAELVLVEARAGAAGRMTMEPPLILKEDDGRDTERAAAIYQGRFADHFSGLPDRREQA